MARRLIIPIFIPFGGCKSQCVYCDQAGITGQSEPPQESGIHETIETWLGTWQEKHGPWKTGDASREVAFYGGSFTALPPDDQARLLGCVSEYVDSGQIDALRVSTRPDCLTDAGLDLLKRHNVETVELGAQSMSDEILRLSGRPHTAKETVEAVRVLKDRSVKVGLQFMPGLPGDTEASILKTAEEVRDLAPDFVRVYPTVVLKGTPLEKMYSRGDYAAWPLDEMVRVCKSVSAIFSGASIPIIRMGLHHSVELQERVVTGPYHPRFADLVANA